LIKPKKSLGQNFLTSHRIISRIIESVSPQASDVVFEIGPGTGALTESLINGAGLVVAIETDPRLVADLRQRFRAANLKIIEADALAVDWDALIDGAELEWGGIAGSAKETADCSGDEIPGDVKGRPRIRIVANLPYYISTPILQSLLSHHRRISDMTLMLQDEVVDRIVARPGGKEYGYLSILAQFYCQVTKLFQVAPASFKPAPKVRSAVLRLEIRSHPIVDIDDERRFWAVVRAAFSQRRKTILNNLKASPPAPGTPGRLDQALLAAGIDPMRRAETLTIAEFARLYSALRVR
jgi:16S rRNA (adenine1518-N6/adenine1519-N6)-dimethyltransferase